ISPTSLRPASKPALPGPLRPTSTMPITFFMLASRARVPYGLNPYNENESTNCGDSLLLWDSRGCTAGVCRKPHSPDKERPDPIESGAKGPEEKFQPLALDDLNSGDPIDVVLGYWEETCRRLD